jgi:hypothetical protein
VLHWDSKGWRTLPMLVARPGKLTRDYVEGKRARHIAPLSLFLALFLLMFMAFSFLGPALGPSIEIEDPDAAVAGIERELAEARAETPPDVGRVAAIEFALATARQAQAEARAKTEIGAAAKKATGAASAEERIVLASDGSGTANPLLEIMRRASKTATVNLGDGVHAGLTAKVRHALENPDLTIYKIQQKAYKLAFLLVPMSVPLLWLLFAGRRGVHLYDHTVFVLYSLSFMSLLVIALVILGRLGASEPLIVSLAFIAPAFHMMAQLKGAYGVRRWGALWRGVVLIVGSLIIASLYLSLMLLLGLFD